jgi:predicted  nucleic acid-binding Zn-ribbon protein
LYGFALIVGLAIAGGVIAYIGDRIGMKVGRHRLSIFGLRPKYTSMIITILTGVMIAGCSIVLLSLASDYVRIALFEIDEIQESLAAARSDLDSKRAEVEDLSTQVELMGKERAALQAEFDLAVAELARVTEEREAALEELAMLQSKLEDSESQLLIASARLEETEAGLKMVSAQLEQARADVQRAQREIASLEEERKVQTEQLRTLTETRDMLASEVAALERALAETTQRSAELLWEAGQLSMWGTVIFRADEVVLGSVIDCSQPAQVVQEQVNDFLLRVNDVARRRGARSSRDDNDPFVLSFEEANVLAAFQKIDEASGKVVLRAISPVNTWSGEPLTVSLHVYPDELIRREGEVIASARVDGAGGADMVQAGILSLVQEVNSILIAEGMPSDEEGKIGTLLSVSEFANAIIEVINSRSVRTVKAVAGADIWRASASPSIRLIVE